VSEIVIEIEKRSLPASFVNSNDFQELDDGQRQGLVARLRYIEEIPIKAKEWLKACLSGEVFKIFIDRVELDLMINLGLPKSSRQQVSAWLFHSSWTFETSASVMLRTLPLNIIDDLQRAPPGFTSTIQEFAEWIFHASNALKVLLDGFYEAATFDAAMGHLIAINISLAQLLVGVSIQRLNPKLSG